MSTVLREDRTVLHVDGVQMFQVSVVCSDRGVLPDTSVFLYQIVDPNDPLQDEFVRIVEIADFAASDAYLPARLSAVLRGDGFWRSAVLSKTYDTIDVANASVQAIFDRVNALVNDYTTYATEFQATDLSVLFPTTDPTQVQSLKTTYDDAYTAYDDAVAAETAAQDGLTAAQDAFSATQAELDAWTLLQTKFSREDGNDQQAMLDAKNAFEAFVATGSYSANGFIGAVDALLQSYRDKFGTRKINMYVNSPGTPYTPPIPSDIGKTVTGGGNTGKLIAFSGYDWWVAPTSATDTFPNGTVVTITAGTGAGTVAASTLYGMGPIDAEISVLRNWRNNFDTARQSAVSAVTKAGDGVTHHGSTDTYITSEVNNYTANISAAQLDVKSKQTAYNQAQGNTQTAYTSLQSAYDAVKAICPNWSPTNPFPPNP